MKLLKNILMAGLLALVCAGCSKDDDDQGLAALASARLTISVRASGSQATKAYNPNDVNELQGEAYINNLSALVFSEDGSTLLGSAWQATPGAEHSALLTDIPAKVAMARIVVLANVPKELISGISSYEDLRASVANLSSQSQSNLSMSSQLISTISPLKEGDNYLGYSGVENINGISSPILVTRLASRVDVVGISTIFAGTKLDGRSVRIDEVSVYDRKTTSRYFSTEDWGAVELGGLLSNSTPVPFNAALITDATSLSGISYSDYVMENMQDATHTKIAVKATLLANDTYAAQTKLFTAVINQNGKVKGYDHDFVKRNYVYRLRLSFNGDSFDNVEKPEEPDPGPDPDPNPDPDPDPDPEPTPDPTTMSVMVEVVGWGPVNQDVVIE